MQEAIVHVDDNEAARYARSRVLRASGFRVIEAATPADALEALALHAVSLVILDIRLTDGNGFELCRTIKSDPRYREIPVVHVSALGLPEQDYPEALESGADAYLKEPVEPSVLTAVAKALINARTANVQLSRNQEIVALACKAGLIGPFSWWIKEDRVHVSSEFYSLFDVDPDPAQQNSKFWHHHLHPDDISPVEAALEHCFQNRNTFVAFDFRPITTKEVRWIHCRGSIRYDEQGSPVLMVGVNVDITERKRLEDELRAMVAEKEVLVKEIQHRVKNNLQVIMSLLNLQAGFLKDPKGITALEQMCSRVHSMAGIHEMLYDSPELSRIDFGTYLVRLTTRLASLYGFPHDRVRVESCIPDATLELGKALPAALIVNELVTNAVKHAFQSDRLGTVEVRFDGFDGQWSLVVGDDGLGLPPGIDPLTIRSMGFQIVRLLVDQLGGTMAVNADQGTKFTIAFPRSAGA